MSKTEGKNTCNYQMSFYLVFGAIILSGVGLLIEFTTNIIKTTPIVGINTMISGTIIVLISLVYFSYLLLYKIYENSTLTFYISIPLIITFIINLGSLIYFIKIFSSKPIIDKISNNNVFEYLKEDVFHFLIVLFIYILIIYYIYALINCENYTEYGIVFLLLTAFSEAIIELLLILKINSSLKHITDG
jgi:hypothetical protein